MKEEFVSRYDEDFENDFMIIKSFVVLDDDCDMDAVSDNFVHVDNKKGLTLAVVEKAVKILN